MYILTALFFFCALISIHYFGFMHFEKNRKLRKGDRVKITHLEFTGFCVYGVIDTVGKNGCMVFINSNEPSYFYSFSGYKIERVKP